MKESAFWIRTHVLCCTLKHLISTRSLDCAESCHFLCFFLQIHGSTLKTHTESRRCGSYRGVTVHVMIMMSVCFQGVSPVSFCLNPQIVYNHMDAVIMCSD